MPIRPLMTYVAAQKRWTKGYRGQTYSVSCRQLGCAAGKEASVLAANAWWQTKQQELDAQAKSNLPDESWAGIVRGLEAVGKPSTSRQEATESLLAILSRPDLPAGFVEAVLGNRTGAIDGAVNTMFGVTDPSRALSAHVKTWLTLLQASVATRQMDVSRYGSYRQHIGIFAAWFGEEASVDGITAPKLEEYWAWLALALAEGRWSAAYCTTNFMTARQFIGRLAELGTIPLPGNIKSRRFTFGTLTKAIVTFTDDEVRTLLAERDRIRLYVLLALNCGMYQSDISDLGRDEIDWDKGTLTRPRSKTGQVTTYQLWPETMALLRQEMTSQVVPNERGSARVLLSEKGGKALCGCTLVDGEARDYDTVSHIWTHLQKRTGVKKPFKCLRKTAATKLAEHPQFKFYASYFLSHAAKSLAERHYVKPSDAEFAAALTWLRSAWL